jgi:glycosyltransferase involved in cell wall biosynthesis
MRISVIVPAFNEGVWIAETLRTLTSSREFGPDIEVIVAANGCTDDTVEIARSFGVRVLEIGIPSKTAALNAADEVASGQVRVYLDADMAVTAGLIRRLAEAADSPGAAAATPRPTVDTSDSSWPVRAYYAINTRLPVFEGHLFGRGIIAISAEARARFTSFPEITADDMFLDAVVRAEEKREIDERVRVVAPRRVAELIRRIARARNGNDEFWRYLRSTDRPNGAPAFAVAGPNSWSWLRDVVLHAPQLLPAACCYVAITVLAERKRRSSGWTTRTGWGRTGPGRSAGADAQRSGLGRHRARASGPGRD